MNVTGIAGVLRAGGRTAAELGQWRLRTEPDGSWVCEASAARIDDYWLCSDAPKGLDLMVGTRRWRYRNVAVGMAGSNLTLSGSTPPEKD